MQAITSERAFASLLATLVALALGSGPALAGEAPAAGAAAPALVARQFDGQVVDLAAQRGHVVLLNFWASWCGPCRAEMPALDALAQELRERGLVVIGLSADDRHDRKDALAASQGVTYMTGMLTDCSSNGFGAPQMLPLTYVIDRAGKLSAVLRANRGALTAGELRSAVDHALGDAVPASTN